MSEGVLQTTFGHAIREQRLQSGISQEALADAAGLHRTYISLLERGQRNPSLTVLFQLAEALDVNASVLVSRVEELVAQKKK